MQIYSAWTASATDRQHLVPSCGRSRTRYCATKRGAQRLQEGFGLFELGIVASVLDHVQRSSVAIARGLGNPQPHRAECAGCSPGRNRPLRGNCSWTYFATGGVQTCTRWLRIRVKNTNTAQKTSLPTGCGAKTLRGIRSATSRLLRARMHQAMYNSHAIRSGSLKATYFLPSVSSTLTPVFSMPASSSAVATRSSSASSPQARAR